MGSAPPGEASSEAEAADRPLIVACGALAREILAGLELAGMENAVDVRCVSAMWHYAPQHIPAEVERLIVGARAEGREAIWCAYADCGTGGLLDEVLARHAVPRLKGAHCYAFFAGQERYRALEERELGTLYLTDFFARQFETVLMKGLGLDEHPELYEAYFRHYKRLVYLAQTDDPELDAKARDAARRLGLTYERVFTGFGELQAFVEAAGGDERDGAAHRPLLARHSSAGDRQTGAEVGETPARRPFRKGDRPRRNARRSGRNRRLSEPLA